MAKDRLFGAGASHGRSIPSTGSHGPNVVFLEDCFSFNPDSGRGHGAAGPKTTTITTPSRWSGMPTGFRSATSGTRSNPSPSRKRSPNDCAADLRTSDAGRTRVRLIAAAEAVPRYGYVGSGSQILDAARHGFWM